MLVALTIVYLFGIPFALMKLAHRWTFINKISPMFILYIIGLAVGNCGIVNDSVAAVCETLSGIVVLLAIPLMLIACNFRLWSTRNVAKAFFTGVLSVLAVTVLGFFIFRPQAMEAGVSAGSYAKISAVMTGIYIGGIPNLGPVSQAVELPKELYLLVSSYDLIVTGLYLIFVIFCGKAVMRKFLPPKTLHNDAVEASEEESKKEPFGKRLKNRLLSVLLSLLVVAVAYGISVLTHVPEDSKVVIIILALTTLSILLSFFKPLKKLELHDTFDLGLYFVYVFCLAIATMVNVSDLELAKNLYILWYIAFAVFGSLVLQVLFAKIFRIDGDTVLVSSIALINSPPFVPLVAAILKNRDVMLTGITIGLLGYAVGNYLGIGIYYLLCGL